MSRIRGFTLLETIMATGILVTASVAVASLFVASIKTNVTNGERTMATLLAAERIEQLKSTPLSNSAWAAGGGLNPASPVPGYSDLIRPANDRLELRRVWQITGNRSRTLTVAVFALEPGSIRPPIELVRATTLVSPKW